MVYGYIRVSTDKQTTENQKIVISQFLKGKRLGKVSWISETISGTKNVNKRKLGTLIEQAQEEDTIVVTELSRLGRSMIMILNVLQELLEKKVRVIAIKEGFELGDNIQSKVLAFAFGISAEIERQLISERTKAGLERARRNDKQPGIKKGQTWSHYKLDPQMNYIKRELKNGRSKSSLALELHVKRETLNRYIKRKSLI